MSSMYKYFMLKEDLSFEQVWLVQCTFWARRMNLTACVNLFEAILQFENMALSLSLHIL